MTKPSVALLFWLGLIILSSVGLYHTSDQVTSLQSQLKSLKTQIDSEQETMRVRKAEWVYLANPARIEADARKCLALQPTPPARVVTLDGMAPLLAMRDGTKLPVAAPPAVQLAEATPPASYAPVRQSRERVVRPLSTEGRINDHITLQHGAAVQASADPIGALIGSLNFRP